MKIELDIKPTTNPLDDVDHIFCCRINIGQPGVRTVCGMNTMDICDGECNDDYTNVDCPMCVDVIKTDDDYCPLFGKCTDEYED